MRHKSERGKNKERAQKLVTLLLPKSPISEAYRTIRTNLQYSSVDKPLHTLMFTSSGPGEGKSTTIANMAVVLAQAGKKILLVDTDLRKPTLHYFFRVPNSLGLTNLLAGGFHLKEVIRETSVEGLHLLPSGPIPPNPAELLGSEKMKQAVEEMKSAYDLILFDTPPVIAVTDAQILASELDGVILVVHSGKTNREMAVKAKGLLETVHANLLGVILNHNKMERKKDYYYYYYGKEA